VLTELDRHGPTQIATLHGEFGHMRSTLTNILEAGVSSGVALAALQFARRNESTGKTIVVLLADTDAPVSSVSWSTAQKQTLARV
jgi:hypothetical protein